ncbi:hypothetical protein B296_00029214 [Ensete ventricosum]|uniref:Protein kinase domain-containing protein n=1 Tax=Ensete ventricosum TaxID=4639 RepID=A0A426XZM0_ENSVE|nr:hypothetical protein B296_00029214 [Ensete ventricosum]
MAGWWHTSLLLFILLLLLFLHGEADVQVVNPMECPKPSPVPACSAFLYVVPRGHNASDTAARYSADASLVEPIRRPSGATDFLVAVPCACDAAGNATALFHDTVYPVQPHDTATGITYVVFSGLAWRVPENITEFVTITVRLPCGCSAASVVSYAVQSGDTLTSISDLLDSDVEAITAMNPELTPNPDYLNPGQLLFVPMGVHGSPPPPPPPPRKGTAAFMSERPVTFSLEEVDRATASFHDSRKIGEGGYGRVYLGILGTQVADFGLAKLVEQSDEDWCFATRLVGTPGYLPPESVRELQMSTKSDVFAFGVVLAELVTGDRALIPDKKEACKMRSLVTAMKEVSPSDDPNAALEEIIDRNLDHVYPMEEVRKVSIPWLGAMLALFL